MTKVSDSPFRRTRRVDWLDHGSTMPGSGKTPPVYILYMFAKCVIAACVLGSVCGCSLVERVSEGVRDLPALLLGQTSSNSDTTGTTSPYNPASFDAPWEGPLKLAAMKPEPLLGVYKIPNKSDVLAVSKEGQVALVRGAQWYKVLSLGYAPAVVDLDPGRRYLISTLPGGGVRVADLYAGATEVAQNTRVSSRIASLCVFPAQNGVVLGGADGKIYRWTFLSAAPREDVLSDLDRSLERYLGSASVISALVCHPGGRFFIAGSWTGSLTAWLNSTADIYEGTADEQLRPGGLFSEVATKVGARGSDDSSVERLSISSDGELMYALKKSGSLEAWSVRGMKLLTATKALRGEARDMALSDDGATIALLARNGEISVWSLDVQQTREGAARTFSLTKRGVSMVPDARLVLVRSQMSLIVSAEGGELRELRIDPLPTESSVESVQ